MNAEEKLPPVLKDYEILIVDGAGATQVALKSFLVELAAERLYFAATTQEMLDVLSASTPDVVLCEYYLDGDRTGQQLLEELRLTGQLHWKTSFILVTGEQRYCEVFGAAEFEPDAYLVKPFSKATVTEKLIQIAQRKKILMPVVWLMAEGHVDRAVRCCNELMVEYPKYHYAIFRLKIACLQDAKRFDECASELRQALTSSPAPWMSMVLAQLSINRRAYAEAEGYLRDVVALRPQFIHARDLLADVLVHQDKNLEAIQVLESIGPAALQNLERLRKLADMATKANDSDRVLRYLEQAVKRSKGGSLTSPDDFVGLASVLISLGRLRDAELVAENMKNSVKGDDLVAARLLIDISKDIQQADVRKAYARLQQLISVFSPSKQDLPSPDLHASLVESCFALENPIEGFSQARHLLSRKSKKVILDRVRAAIERAGGGQSMGDVV